MQSLISMTIRLPNHLAEKIKRLARENNTSFNAIILDLLLHDPELVLPDSSEGDLQSPGSLIADSDKPRPRSYRAKKRGDGY